MNKRLTREVATELLAPIQRTCAPFRELCRPLNDLFDVTYVQWIENQGEQCKILTTHPKLWEHYLENKYYLTDPHLVSPSQMSNGSAFWSSYPSPVFLGSYVHDASEYFNVDFGVTFVMKTDPSTYQAFCLASYPANIQFKNMLLNASETLRGLLLYIGRQIKENFLSAHQIGYSALLPSLKGTAYQTQRGMVSHLNEEKEEMKKQALNDLLFGKE